jgi:hypothetical protein
MSESIETISKSSGSEHGVKVPGSTTTQDPEVKLRAAPLCDYNKWASENSNSRATLLSLV